MLHPTRRLVTTWIRHLDRISPRVIDAVLAVAVAAATSFAIASSDYRDSQTREPNALAYTIACAIGALVLLRRRWSVGVLLGSVLLLQFYHSLNFPGLSAALPLAVALYTAAATGHLRWSLGVSLVYMTGTLIYALFFSGEQGLVLNEAVRDGSLLLALLLFGDAVRTHRALMAEASARLRRAEADRRRDAQELSAARVIQEQLLPKDLPDLSGWRITTHYQPARAVGGDFYDILELPNGQIALIIGDASDKGIPAALVMATTHSILRGLSPALLSPGAVLAQANDRLYPDTPATMFVTCLYALLDPATGHLRFANAGHNLPYLLTPTGVTELRATGMPLGAMPGMTYDEQETCLSPGATFLLSSDGLTEAHNPTGEMFGLPRLRHLVEASPGGDHLIPDCLAALRSFVGDDWEQEDDITLVTLQRTHGGAPATL